MISGSGKGLSVQDGMGYGAGAQALIQAASSIATYFQQKAILGIKLEMAKAAYDHQDTMAKKEKESQISSLGYKENNQKLVAKYQKEQNDSKEELAKAKGEHGLAKAKLGEAHLTKKTAQINTHTLNRFYDLRGKYTNNGNPRVAI